jgi:CHAT domain-containing protein/Flp pilus assembly protein TadD
VTANRTLIAAILILGASLNATPAQQSYWQELHERVAQLSRQQQYAEMLTAALEALRIAERSFGIEHVATAVSTYDLAFAYDSLEQFQHAEIHYRRALTLEEKTLGPNHTETLKCINNLAALYSRTGRDEQAEPLLLRVVRTSRSSADPAVKAGGAAAAFNLAELYSRQGKSDESEPLYKESLSIAEKGAVPVAADYVLYHFALSYRKQGKLEQAETLLKRALTIRESSPTRDSLATAEILSTLGATELNLGRYSDAETFYRRALILREAFLGTSHPDVAAALVAIGIVNNDQHRPAEALSVCRRAGAIAEKLRGAEAGAGSDAWMCIAAAYLQQDKFEDSEAAFKRSIQILRSLPAQPSMELAMALNGLGELYRSAGRFADAEAPFRESLAVIGQQAGPASKDYAMTLNNLGLLYKDQGRYAEAEPLHQRSLAIVEKAAGTEHIDVTYPLNALASLYIAQNRFRDAEPLVRRALRIREMVYGLDNPAVATLVNNLAVVYSGLGRHADAEPFKRRALAVDEKTLGPDHPIVATDAGNLGRTYVQLNRPAEAEALFQRALRIADHSLGPNHPEIIHPLTNLGMFYYGRGDFARAEPLFDRALQSVEQQFQHQFSYMSERDRLSFLSTVVDTFSMYLSFCFRFHQRQPALAGKMYDLALWEKGLIARSISSLRRQIAESGDTQSALLLEQLSSRKAQLASLRTAQLKNPDQSREDILGLEKEINELETTLVRRSAVYSESQRLAGVQWQDIAKTLQAGEAAVEFLRFDFRDEKKWTGESYYVAMVLSHTSSTGPQVVWLGEAANIEGAPFRDYRALVDPAEVPAEKTGELFYEAVWRPLEPFLSGTRRVYLSPDGVFNEVSWAVIPAADGRLLSERFEIQLLLSTRDLMRIPSAPFTRSAILVGAPDFDLTADRQRAAPAVPGRASGVSAPSAVRGDSELKPLPGAQRELQSVRSQLERRGWQTRIYTGPDALEENVKTLRSPRLLHLATHGFFAADAERVHADSADNRTAIADEPMLRSGLYLAGANRVLKGSAPAEGLDDGVLTAYEASELSLRGTELVVLSACETGLGVTRNAEGVFGLRRALQEAGTDAVLMSLWKVPDRDTEELMSIFYEAWLSGATKQAALHQAQLEMRNRVRSRRDGQDVPYYWGAFVLVGR